MDDMNQALVNLTPEQRQLVELMLRQSEGRIPIPPMELASVVNIAAPKLETEKHVVMTDERVPLSPNQKWFFEQDFPDQHHYNIASFFEVMQPLKLDPVLVKEVVRHLELHHDALRLRFVRNGSEWQQFTANPGEDIPVSTIDLSALPAQEQEQATEKIASEIQTSLNIFEGPLLRIVLFEFGAERPSRLLFTIHHLVTDSFSNGILMQDFMTVCQQISLGQPVQLLTRTTSFKEWSERLVEYAQSPLIQQELPYWQAKPNETLPGIVPTDHPVSSYIYENVYRVLGVLSDDETRILLQNVLKAFDLQIIELMLAAMAEAIGQTKGERSLFVDILRHGRDIPLKDVELSCTVGWFVIHYPLLLKLDGAASFKESLPLVKKQYRKPHAGGIGYDLLRYVSGNEEIKKTLMPRPVLVFSHDSQSSSLNETLIRPIDKPIKNHMSLLTPSPYLLELRTMVVNRQLHWTWTSGEPVYHRSTIERLSENFGNILKSCLISAIPPR